jgi:hypothetical protein
MTQYKKRPYNVSFGYVEGENRADEKLLITPPITINDNYYWLRDDNRTNHGRYKTNRECASKFAFVIQNH